MYNAIQGLAMIIYIVVLTFYGKYFGFSRLKSFFLGTSAVIVDYFFIMLLTWAESGFKEFGSQNAVRIFVLNPLLIFIMAKVIKADFRKLCDYHAFPAMVWYGLGHLACVPQGCCHGYAYYEGTTMCNIANTLTGTNMLPQQLLESLGALLIAGLLLVVAIKKKHQTNGYMYYIMLILYGSQRFIAEFFRDNDKIIVFGDMTSADGKFGISNLAIWALAMVVEGAIILAIFVYKDKKKKKKKTEIAAKL